MAINVTVTPQVQEVEVSATVQPYEVEVIVNQDLVDYVEEARQSAQDAEASANSASLSASSASNSAGLATASASTATTQAGIATTKANLATEKATLAGTKADEAAQSAAEALNSKNSAQSSADTATTQANLATDKAALATTKANEASQSANNALASEQAAGANKDTAITQAGIATTKAGEAATSASNALSAKNASEAARDTAITQAGIATTKADEAATSASNAATAKNASEAARDTAITQSGIATTKASEALASQQAASISEGNALVSEQNAAASEAIALQAQSQAEYAAVQAGTSASVAQQAANNAVAVVTGGTASLTPQAGRIPIADANGKIDAGWIDPVSGIDSQALHRSPNAVTAMFIYDTSKDSDGGAWTEKCQHTSWYNETMQGRWLGQQLNEAAARAITGAATNDYYQQTSDGRFYRLNAGSGITEVFRGNKRSFPKIAGIVAEAANVTIYDLTESGNPMWMRFFNAYTGSPARGFWQSTNCNIRTVNALNSVIMFGSADNPDNTGLMLAEMIKDQISRTSFSLSWGGFGFNVSQRNLNQQFPYRPIRTIVNSNVISISSFYDQSSLFDINSGLKHITIGVATQAGLSIWRTDRGIVNSSSTTSFTRVSITPSLLIAVRNGTELYYAKNPNSLGASFSLTAIPATQDLGFGTSQDIQSLGLSKIIRGINTSQVKPALINIDAFARSISGTITNQFNTGYMVGDVRRAYLSDVSTIQVSDSELVNNNTFDSNITGWASQNSAVLSWDNGRILIDRPQAGGAWQDISVVPFQVYQITSSPIQNISGTGQISIEVYAGSGFSPNIGGMNVSTSAGANFIVRPTTNIIRIFLYRSAAGVDSWDNVSVKQVVPDRSFRSRSVSVFGTVLRSLVATGADLVAYSGFSNSNYLREPYSSELDFGTGEVHLSSWVNIPTVIPQERFLVTATELINPANLPVYADLVYSTDRYVATNLNSVGAFRQITNIAFVLGRTYEVVINIISISSGSLRISVGNTYTTQRSSIGVFTERIQYTQGLTATYISGLSDFTGEFTFSIKEVSPVSIFERSFSSGSRLRLALTSFGAISASLFDGTTTREVLPLTLYNIAQWLKVEANYIAGRLSLLINGVEVAATTGNPLLTLNNASAVLTIGNNFDLNAPFPGSLALVKLSATTPSAEQSLFMYEQEKQLLRENAKCILPDANAVTDLTYDDVNDQWIAVSSTNESNWTGLVRNSVRTPSAGAFSRVESRSGFELMARTTTNIGVDVTKPSYGILRNMLRRAEDAARLTQDLGVFEFVGGFTATTVNGNVAITSVANLSYPQSFIGARVSGSGIPANTTIVGVSGTTIFLSAAATASASNVNISFLDFNLPAGFDPTDVKIAGVTMREGATRDYIKLYDGFKQTVRFAVAPSTTAWIQIICKKEIQ